MHVTKTLLYLPLWSLNMCMDPLVQDGANCSPRTKMGM